MWSYFAKGGPVMWPLLVLSILAVVVIVWRWLALRDATRNAASLMSALRERLVARDPMGAVAACDAHPGAVASIVKAGLLRLGRPKDEIELGLQDASAHELMVLERGLPVLATVAMVAPLLGFLGTVTGMINSFDALAAGPRANSGRRPACRSRTRTRPRHDRRTRCASTGRAPRSGG